MINSHNLRYFVKKKQGQRGLDFCCVYFSSFEKYPDYQKTIASLPKNSALIFREYNLKKPKRQELALKIQKVCQQYQHKFIVGKDLQLATRVRADGVHFSDHDQKILLKKPKNMITTLSCHDLRNITLNSNIDILFFSPIFVTNSHPGAPTKGILQLKRAQTIATKPVFALGGIKNSNINKIFSYCSGIGGIEIFKEN